jgi:nucleotide-binding universal stress UspA family protein
MTERILVAYDGSTASRAALRWAVRYAVDRGAEVVMVYAVSSATEWELCAAQIDPDPIRRDIERNLRTTWSSPCRAAGVACRTSVVVGHPADVILERARREHVDLVVIGMSPRGTLHELVATATGRHILRASPQPVVVVPPEWSAPASSTITELREAGRRDHRTSRERASASTV